MPVNPINIDILEILDAIDRRGSFAKAAEELNKATSALSYAIQKLEEQLSITIFQREGRRSVLTPAGQLILEDGRAILNATKLLAEKAREVATGWEPKLRIALESTVNHEVFFDILNGFLYEHESMEIDISESVLNGGWEALENNKIDLLVGAPGPVPQQKGFRAIGIEASDMIPVISKTHPQAHCFNEPKKLETLLPNLRRVVSHDTATVNIARNIGLSMGKRILYVQTMDQKIQAQLAGLGIGHLPRHRIQTYLDDGILLPLPMTQAPNENFIAWKISHKGKALQTLSQRLVKAKWK
ncbi:MAG: DNA-binding transcriptional LysR family regulator [Oleiphilaceae bacterium]|jgi:DNA-binding transcriptional LysR family regulator